MSASKLESVNTPAEEPPKQNQGRKKTKRAHDEFSESPDNMESSITTNTGPPRKKAVSTPAAKKSKAKPSKPPKPPTLLQLATPVVTEYQKRGRQHQNTTLKVYEHVCKLKELFGFISPSLSADQIKDIESHLKTLESKTKPYDDDFPAYWREQKSFATAMQTICYHRDRVFYNKKALESITKHVRRIKASFVGLPEGLAGAKDAKDAKDAKFKAFVELLDVVEDLAKPVVVYKHTLVRDLKKHGRVKQSKELARRLEGGTWGEHSDDGYYWSD